MIRYDVLRQKYIKAMSEIERECFDDPWSEEMLAGELDNPLAFYVVALRGERVVGYAGMHKVLDEAYITNVAVTADFRRRGIADALMEHLFGECRDSGIDYITLEVREDNTGAQRLYEKNGFERCGRRVKYYGGVTDALIYSRYGLLN